MCVPQIHKTWVGKNTFGRDTQNLTTKVLKRATKAAILQAWLNGNLSESVKSKTSAIEGSITGQDEQQCYEFGTTQQIIPIS